MKAHSSYFQQKNTKRGLALSTTMAISIVLAILVALLVSMATLNITTTQDTVNQREAYIQAKSAIAFAESYYSQHADQIPGRDSSVPGGEALMVFNSSTVADGAKVYITKTDASTYAAGLDETAVQNLKNDAPDTYVEIVNTSSTLVATAYCKYGENDAYELSKEFDMRPSGTGTTAPFTGNIVYSPTSDTRYLRIHVRTSEAFYNEPYLYVWGATMNPSDSPTAVGKSSLVNKMSDNSDYPNIKFSGEWDPEDGPTGAMEYEGNGWYVYEIEISTKTSIEYVNAIVTRKDAVRTSGDEAQSWEFFGIPVPKETGEANGADVYITLNQSRLLDARNTSGHSTVDDLTRWFESTYHADVDEFAQFSGKWYTVYTKNDTATVHYRKAEVYDDSEGIGGFSYEGYGWWRNTSNNLNDSVTVGGNTYHYYEGETISENAYGKEVVKELFICEDSSGNVATFGTEAEANDWFVNSAGDVDADDYVTINVKANEQPVNGAVTTTIEYSSEVITGATPPTPGTIISTDTDTDTETTEDSDVEVATVSYEKDEEDGEDEEPTVLTLKSSSTDKLGIQSTAATLADVEASGAAGDYAIAGTFNNWGLNDAGQNRYENIDDMTQTGTNTYEITYTGLQPGVTYEFKVIEKLSDSGNIEWSNASGSHSWGNGGANYTFTVSEVTDATITFESAWKTIDVSLSSGGGGSSGKTYSVIGWLNNWGRLSDTSDHYYENLNDMEDQGDCNFVYTAPTLVNGGQNYTFKIVEKLADEGTLEAYNGWTCSWGGSGEAVDSHGNYVINLSSYPTTSKFSITIRFNENTHQINVEANQVDVDDGTYYLVGTYNDWADGHQYSKAIEYPLTLSGVDSDGNTIYKCDIGRRYPGTEEVKVISSAAELPSPVDGKTINYEYSWGDADGSGITYGSDKAAFSYTLSETSDVVITFTVNPLEPDKSRITYSFTPYDPNHSTYTYKYVGFYNNQLVNVNDATQKTDFTTPWTSVYVTYFTDREGLYCEEVSMTSGTDIVWAYVPTDAQYMYFSNMDMTYYGTAGYEYTESIDASMFVTITNPIFFPKTSTPDSHGVLWTMGDSTEYSHYAYTVTNFSETAEMVYVGSSQTNYYDVPMVKMLKMLVTGDPDSSGKYAFSAYCYSSYDTEKSYLGGTVHFNSSNYVDYQGERYYYTPVSASYSYLIVQNKGDSSGVNKQGILLENHFALMSEVKGGLATNMDNRGGAVFTSDGYYYNGDTSPHSYGGYTPSWYTYKIHASTSYTIKNIKGVTSTSTSIISSNSIPTDVVKSDTYYNQPLYIYKDADGNTKVYTYNTDTGKVDTTSDSKVSVYFNKPSSWSSKVYCYAYGIGTSTVEEVYIDSSNADNNYYQFTFDSGKYAYFVFYDYNATCSDGSVIKNDKDKLSSITAKTGVLYLTGEENDNREYAILADGEGATSFTYFLHPKTAALYAFQEARSAYNESKVFEKYSYSSSTGEYSGIGSMKTMSSLESKMNAAKSYWEHGSSGKWSVSGSNSYSDLASAAREFSDAITNARIYIAEEDPAHPDDADYIFPEGEYRDDIITYKERWVNELKTAYENAMAAYSDTSLQNAGSLRALAASINDIIASPETILAPDAVKLIVDDQSDDAGNGLWGKNNINVFNDGDSSTWVDTGYQILDTSQADYYAFVFKLTLPGKYAILQDGQSEPEAGKEFTLTAGTSYIYHTATGVIESYDETAQTIITTNEIKEGTSTAMWAVHESALIGKEFELYFKYDTTVTGGGESYVIRAGSYTINASYTNFSSDFTGKTGINLFTTAAKNFFTNPTRYGMNLTSSTDYTTWDSCYLSDGTHKDIMCDSIVYSGEISAKSTASKNVSFRYNGAKDHDTLILNQDVLLEAGIVNMAVNNLKLNGYDFTIEAKTVVFYTDVEVTTSSGTDYTILHGTYIFNDTGSGTTAEISLNDPNWKNNYILIDELDSELRGGKFVAKE